MPSVRSNNLSLKYETLTLLDWKDIEIRKFKFVAKTQFLCYSGKYRNFSTLDFLKAFDKPILKLTNLVNLADVLLNLNIVQKINCTTSCF